MPKAIIYCRVSTGRQAREGISLEAQENKARAWCDLHGHEFGGVYSDAGLSGRRADNRPELQKALDVLQAGDTLVIYSLSRLARSVKDTIAIGEILQKRKADLVSLSEDINTKSAAGRLIFKVFAAVAEFESEIAGERISMAHQYNKGRGRFTGGKRAPYGFTRGGDGKTLEPVESEQAVITLIKEHRAAGLSLQAISDELARAGMLSRTAKPFAPQQVKRIAQAA